MNRRLNESESEFSLIQNESSTQNSQNKSENSLIERELQLKKKNRLETVRETNSEFSYKKGCTYEENRNPFSKKSSILRSSQLLNESESNTDKLPIEEEYNLKIENVRKLFHSPSSTIEKKSFNTDIDYRYKFFTEQKEQCVNTISNFSNNDCEKRIFSKYKFIFEDDIPTKTKLKRKYTSTSKKY